MSKSLEEALGNGAWSVSAVIFDLNAMIDEEGRPISERRADASARVGVEMEMKKCPFSGTRLGKWMNFSALIQINHYFKPVTAEMAAFRRQLDSRATTWDDILACVVDQLAGPAIYLLQNRSHKGPVPAKIAVGHKLSAGFFGAIRNLHKQSFQGLDIPVTVDGFMSFIDETNALVGASEVCAGSEKMIRKACSALFEGNADNDVDIEPQRLQIARCLALQVQLGIVWKMYDSFYLWSLLKGECSKHLIPCNDFLQRKFEMARNGLDEQIPKRPDDTRLPATIDLAIRQQLIAALNDSADPKLLKEDIETALKLLKKPGSVIHYDGDIEIMALKVANYLHSYRLFMDVLSKLELQLREFIGFSADAPVRLGAAVFPPPQALPWFELICGCRHGEQGHLDGSCSGVRITPLS